MMDPLLITAHTPHGVVLSRPWGIALDGLLASVIWHRRKHAAHATGAPWRRFTAQELPEPLPLPLQRCGAGDDDWHWMCTFSDQHPHTVQPDTRWRTSRTDHARLQDLSPAISRQRVSDARGRYRYRAAPILAHPTTHLTWRAVGDPDRIGDLLDELAGIGKHNGTGEGRVTSWTIDPIADRTAATMWECGHEHAPGVLGRPVPERCIDEHPDGPARRELYGEPLTLRRTAIRAPYLHPSSHHLAYLPHR